MGGIDLRVKLLGIFVISFIFIYSFFYQNNVIERIWVEVITRGNYLIKDILSNFVASYKIDMGNEVTRFCISWVSCNVSRYGLTNLVQSWNNHRIPSKATV